MRAVVVIAALVGCGSDKGASDSGSVGGVTVPVTSFEATFDTCRETALTVAWESSEEGTPEVAYGPPGLLDTTTPAGASGTRHSVAVRGLVNGGTYEVRPVTVTASGERIEEESMEVTAPFTPAELLPLTIDVSDPASEVASGHILLSTLGSESSYAAILEASTGQYTWWVSTGEENVAIGRARPSRDGQRILWNDYDRSRIDDVATIRGSSVDTCDEQVTRTVWGHHDFVELPDGAMGWMGFTFDEALEIEGYGAIPVAADNIYEAETGFEGEDAREVWNALEDWDCKPTWVGDTMELGAFIPEYHEWSHGNSLAYLDDDDAYFIMLRYLDALVKVDRATGETVWTMGGDCGDVANAEEGEPFWSYPHFSHVWREDGALHVLMFDNGDNYRPPASRIVEYVVDEDAGTASKVWEHAHPEGAFVRIVGDARRLPGGNTLISWTPLGVLEEVTPDGTTMWKATGGIGQTLMRVHFIPDLYAGVDAMP